jgi:hypothetical protein
MMIFNVAPLSPVCGEPVFAAPGRKIEGGWAAFYAFLPQCNAEVRSARRNEEIPSRVFA